MRWDPEFVCYFVLVLVLIDFKSCSPSYLQFQVGEVEVLLKLGCNASDFSVDCLYNVES